MIMLKKMRKWFTPKTKVKKGRPKLAKKSVLKAAKIELVMTFLLLATFTLAGTSTLTGRSPLELLSFGLASKASGNAVVGGGSVDLVCGSLGKIGTYKISSSSTSNYSSALGISNIPKVWVKSTNFNVNAPTGRLTNNSYYVNIVRYELKNSAGTTICNGQFYNAGSNLKYKVIIVNVTINKGTFYAVINVSAEIKNKTTKDTYAADTISGSHHSSEGLRLDNSSPKVESINVFQNASDLAIKSNISDGGSTEGNFYYKIYTYNAATGKVIKNIENYTGKYKSKKDHFYNTKLIDLFQKNSPTSYAVVVTAKDSVGNVTNSKTTKCFAIKNYKIDVFNCGSRVTTTKPKISISVDHKSAVIPKGEGIMIRATISPKGTPITWKSSNSTVAKILQNNKTSIMVSGVGIGKANITATTPDNQVVTIPITVQATVLPTTSQSGGGGRNTTTKSTTTVTSKKQVDVSEIVGGVVITITPDPTSPYTTIKYGKVAKMITTFTRTPSTLPPRYRQWYTYYKDKASDKWVLNWGTKDSTTGQVAPCTLVKDTVGASPTLSMNHKYRVGKWLIYSDSKCTKHLGSVLTPVYTAY